MHQGRILESLVKRNGMGATVFASHLGVTRIYVYELYKKDFIPSETIGKVCSLFKVSPGIFFDESGINGITVLIVSGKVEQNEKSVSIDNSKVVSLYYFPGG